MGVPRGSGVARLQEVSPSGGRERWSIAPSYSGFRNRGLGLPRGASAPGSSNVSLLPGRPAAVRHVQVGSRAHTELSHGGASALSAS